MAPHPSSWAMVRKSQVLCIADPQLYDMENNIWSLSALAPANFQEKASSLVFVLAV